MSPRPMTPTTAPSSSTKQQLKCVRTWITSVSDASSATSCRWSMRRIRSGRALGRVVADQVSGRHPVLPHPGNRQVRPRPFTRGQVAAPIAASKDGRGSRTSRAVNASMKSRMPWRPALRGPCRRRLRAARAAAGSRRRRPARAWPCTRRPARRPARTASRRPRRKHLQEFRRFGQEYPPEAGVVAADVDASCRSGRRA